MDEADTPGGAEGAAGQPAGESQPTEEELRAQLEEEIRQVRVQDLVLQNAVSILNLSARRIAKDDERDLEQAKAGIDAADALLDHVPEEAKPQLKQAVSELKMLFAQHSGGAGGGGDAPEPEGKPEEPPKPKDSGLWTPGGP